LMVAPIYRRVARRQSLRPATATTRKGQREATG
jgi:hypothetical protein